MATARKLNTMGKATIITVALLAVILIGFVVAADTTSSSSRPDSMADTSENTANTTTNASTPVSMWNVSTSKDDVTGAVTTIAIDNNDGDNAIIVRKRGKRLELYINTPDFLETMDNVETGVSTVAYRFDGGSVTRQAWSLSENNRALFYPGNPISFLRKLAHAKSFAFRYSPADKVPVSETFDVSGFPTATFIPASSHERKERK